MDNGIVERGTNQTVSLSRESEIAYAVQPIESAWCNGIAYLGRLGILLLNDFTAYLSIEIAMVAKHRLSHLSA